MESREAFGKVLQSVRKQQCLTQQVLADQAVVERNYISRIELGKSCPSVCVVFKICAVLRVPPSAMLARVEELIRSSPETRQAKQARPLTRRR